MAFLTEAETYEAGVYRLETDDPVEGGEGGVANTQANQLANRTKWLKAAILAIAVGGVLQPGITQSSLTTVGVLAAPHMTAPVIDSGGLTVTAGTTAVQAITGTTAVLSSTAQVSGLVTATSGVRVGSGPVLVNGTATSLWLGFMPAGAITSTTDLFFGEMGDTHPLNPALINGSLLIYPRNTPGAETVLAAENAVIARISATGVAVTGLLTTSQAVQVPGNNNAGVKARNAANSGYLDLLYMDGSDRAQIPRALVVGGALSVTTGTTAVQAITGTTLTLSGAATLQAVTGTTLTLSGAATLQAVTGTTLALSGAATLQAISGTTAVLSSTASVAGLLTATSGVKVGNGNVTVNGAATNLWVGFLPGAITSTTDLFVGYMGDTHPLNPGAVNGALLLYPRNAVGAEIVLAALDAVIARISTTGVAVTGLLTTSQAVQVPGNNNAGVKARNAANSVYVDLLYMDSSDVGRIPRALTVGGALTVTTGTTALQAITGTSITTSGNAVLAGTLSVGGVVATSANTASAIVARDVNGDFAMRNLNAASVTIASGGANVTGNVTVTGGDLWIVTSGLGILQPNGSRILVVTNGSLAVTGTVSVSGGFSADTVNATGGGGVTTQVITSNGSGGIQSAGGGQTFTIGPTSHLYLRSGAGAAGTIYIGDSTANPISIGAGGGVTTIASGLTVSSGTTAVQALTTAGITATGAVLTTVTGETFRAVGATTSARSIRVGNTTGDFYLGVNDSASTYFTTATAYASVLYSPNNPIEVVIAGTKRLSITTAGADVVGVLTASTSLTTPYVRQSSGATAALANGATEDITAPLGVSLLILQRASGDKQVHGMWTVVRDGANNLIITNVVNLTGGALTVAQNGTSLARITNVSGGTSAINWGFARVADAA